MTLIKATNKFLRLVLCRVSLFSGILLPLLFFMGCTTLHSVVIDAERPPEITLPISVRNIIIVDNTVPQPEDMGHYDFHPGKKEPITLVKVVNDSDVNALLAETFFENIGGKKYFKEVFLYELPIREDLNFDEIKPLEPSLSKKICSENKADAIISLDKFLVTSVSHDEDDDYGAVDKFLDLKMTTCFQVYSKEGETISPPLYMNDSIYWAATYIRNRALTDTIPARKEAIKEAARYMAQKMADSFAPYRTSKVRWYFGDVKEANKKIAQNNRNEALALWQSAYDSETKNIKKKARLASNIALAYELSDDLKSALKWVNTSCELFKESLSTNFDEENLKRATLYKEDLMERYKDFRLLDILQKSAE